MTPEQIQRELENAVGTPEEALREAVAHSTELAPAVIAVMRGMAAGRLPLPREERLLRFGLHALAVAREPSACPAFVALLRCKPLELEWLFGDDERIIRTARLLISLFDGNDTALLALVADTSVDGDVRSAALEALARLVWEGRASHDALVALLDRLDREVLAAEDSWVWHGWASAIMLLGLTEWKDRVAGAYEAGRQIPLFDREVDRQDWLERTQAAAEHPEDGQRFVNALLSPYEDAVSDVGWYAEAVPDGPEDPLSGDEMAWLDVALWRRAGTATMCLETADGFLTGLAAGPVRLAPSDCLTAILGAGMIYDSPEHEAYIASLLGRRLASIEYLLAEDEDIEPELNRDMGDLEASLWATGYMLAIEKCKDAWQPLLNRQTLFQRLVLPIMMLLHDPEAAADDRLTEDTRWDLIEALPSVVSATRSFWQGRRHPLLPAQRERTQRIGRNDPCTCGSGKKYKRCCGAAA